MTVAGLSQPPFNTSLLGVVRGVADYYAIGVSDATLYGASGHAFLMNIHPEVCPSGPYVWNYDGFIKLLRNIGIEMECLGFIGGDSPFEAHAQLEKAVRERLDRGEVCSVVNMENQLIIACDDQGFSLIQPWGDDCGGMTPARLTFGSWKEFGAEIHAASYTFRKIEPAPARVAALAALAYAVDLYDHPDSHRWPPYEVGAAAWENWIAALRAGKAHPHGNWWNAMVWSECRRMASRYFGELEALFPANSAAMKALGISYARIADALEAAGNREASDADRITRLEEAAAVEGEGVRQIINIMEHSRE